jgi:hypothetical protein
MSYVEKMLQGIAADKWWGWGFEGFSCIAGGIRGTASLSYEARSPRAQAVVRRTNLT